MNNAVADGILRIVGRLNGVRPYRWLPRLEEMQWWDQTRMQDWQQKELARILEHATATTPYYREVLPRSAVARASRDLAALAELPILTKDLVRSNFDRLQSPKGYERGVQHISTSGSTGQPLKVVVDNPCFGRYFAAKFRALRWHGVNFADRQLRVWGRAFGTRKRSYWQARDLLQNRMRLLSLDMSDETLERLYPKIAEFKPVYINGYTSAIQRFASFLEQKQKDGRQLEAKLVVPTAEMLYDWQREQMERVFGCKVMNEYGGCEIQAIAYECPEGGFHITHENMIVEVLDAAGRSVPDGEEGLLTVTSLCAEGMPMIRYQNGDMVVRTNGAADCPCGRHRGLPRMLRIVGRSSDVLLRCDGQATHWTTMYYAIKDAFVPEMVLEHQARQRALDLIEIMVVKGPQYSEAAMARFLERMRSVLGAGMRFDVKFVTDIPREKSGKYRYFISDIPRAKQDENLAAGV